MKIQQLEHFLAVVENDFNLSLAAVKLFTTQPAVSKQIASLEDELKVKLFLRRGKRILDLTTEGRRILEYAKRALQEIANIRAIGESITTPNAGFLSIATTHTQARYFLPKVIPLFKRWYPDVELHIEQNNPQQNAKLVADGLIDMAICTEALHEEDRLITLPCYRWNRHILVPSDHPLAQQSAPLTLELLATFPLVSYSRGFTGRPKLDQAFVQKGLNPNIVIAASDADVIKTYVRMGMGVGIVAQMAFEPRIDADLVMVDASHLFPNAMTWVAYRQDRLIKRYMFDFIKLLTPRIKLAYVDSTIRSDWQEEQVPWFRA